MYHRRTTEYQFTNAQPISSAPRFVICALSGFHASREGVLVSDFGSNKARALLIYLLMESDRAHMRTALANLFWPDRSARAALNNLNQTLFMLRRALHDNDCIQTLFVSNRLTVQINPTVPIDFDVTAFMRLVNACSTHQHRLDDCDFCTARFAEAINYYQGAFLDGFSLPDAPEFEEWLQINRERLHMSALDALNHLFVSSERHGNLVHVQQYGHRLLQLEPWNEPAHRALISALAATGNYSAALHQFELCRKTLANDLGLDPEPATMALVMHVRGAMERRRIHTTPMPRPPTPCPGLPACSTQGNPFIGRAAALETCTTFMAGAESRLLTIVGSSGVGKSYLAQQVAMKVSGTFRDGVVFVAMNEQSDRASLPTLIARALGLVPPDADAQPSCLLKALSGYEMLLVIDALDHRHYDAPFLDEISRCAPRVKQIVTARDCLGLDDEQIFVLRGMESPGVHEVHGLVNYDAVQLFISSAAVQGKQICEGDLIAVARICRLLDGLPRGIILASALTTNHRCEAIARLIT